MRHITEGIMAVLLLVAVIFTINALVSGEDQPVVVVPPAVVTTIDSLERTAPADSALVDSLRQSNFALQSALSAERRASRMAQDSAGVAQARADSLAAVAGQAGGTAEGWQGAYEARTVEAGALREQVASQSRRISLLEQQVFNDSVWISLLSNRLAKTQEVNRQLQDAIAKANAPCTIPLVGVRCPTRTELAAGWAIREAVGAIAK